MKTRQEILLKAKEYAESIGSKDGTVIYDYAMGYTQCQEDMKQKLEQFYNHGKWAIIEHGHGDTFEDYYNKTFKQD